MKTLGKACILHALVCGAAFGAFAACGDDVTFGPDSGLPKTDATIDQSTPADGGAEAQTAKLLMTYAAANGELVALDTTTKAIGRVSWPADQGEGIAMTSGKDTFLLETGPDLVARLDPSTYASVASSWSVALDDGVDGGLDADPVQVVEVAPNKAYVLRFNRNKIAIIDPSQSADAGAATSSIDLSTLVQSGDEDGNVDMTDAFYDANDQRLYVVLGNVDLYSYDPITYDLVCGTTHTTMIAIDTTNDTLVNLGGAGPGGGIELNGYNPQAAIYNGAVYDAANNRALVVSIGCVPSVGDGGFGAIQQRLVEAVNLQTNTTATLLDASAQDIPNVFSYIDATHALIQFGYFAPYITTYAWDPTQTTLGAALATTPDVFDHDDAGHILGPQSTFTTDGAAGPINVISVTLADGGVVQLAQNPFLQSGGYLGNALYVP
jgi:hypothetical protein